MSLFAEFRVPADAFALHETLDSLPEAVIEIERVVAVEDGLTPYFWVSGCSLDAFESAAEDDPSLRDLRRLDRFEDATLYRADWTERVRSLVYVHVQIDAVILEAAGTDGRWTIKFRFDGREQLEQFQSFCQENRIAFDLQRLAEITRSGDGRQYDLTPKQHEALETAWKMGHFENPRRATLEDISDCLDITPQSLSKRLRRGHHSLIASTLDVANDPGTE